MTERNVSGGRRDSVKEGSSSPEGSDRTDAEVLRELDELRRQLKESSDGKRGRAVKSDILGRQFPMPGMDEARSLLLDEVRDGACVVSSDGHIILCNGAFARLIGAPIDQLVGHPIFSHLKEGGKEAAKRLLSAWTAGRNVEVEFRRVGGGERRVSVVARRTHLYGFRAFCLVTRDLTEQQTMAAIVKSDGLSDIVFEQAADAMLVCDTDGKILRANRRATDLSVRFPELGRVDECFRFSVPGAPPPADGTRPVEDWLRGEEHAPLELDLLPIHGPSIRVHLTAGPIHNANGRFLGWVVTLTDITGRVAAEQESRDWAERERVLNESLRRQADELAGKNRELEQFALIASHDLQEPLRKINSFGDLLQEEGAANLTPRSLDYIARMKTAARRMSLMIEDLLQYARAGSQEERLETVDSGAVMQEVVTRLEEQIERTGTKVTWDPLPVIRSSHTLLPQLLLNLVNNAIKYRSPENPRVHVSAERKDGAWEFSVADNGIGIDPRYFDRIFQIFERLHTRSQYLGTGIGLAICKRIVERHDGRIWVESALGQGATFRFTLPDPSPHR